MTNDEKRLLAGQILVSLYNAWAEHTIVSLDPIRQESGLEEGVFHDVVEGLEKQRGLIKAYGSWYTYEITPAGILYTEDNELISIEIADKHRKVRSDVLNFLAGLREQRGSLAEADVEELAGKTGTDKFEILTDLSFLNNIGYIRDTSSNTYQITEEGLRHFRGVDYQELL